MFSPITLFFRGFSLIFFLLILVTELSAQCDPPAELPTVQCQNAPITCINEACYSTSNQGATGWNLFCGNGTAIHNPQYFEIIPIDACIEIHIHVDNCEQGSTALQSALVTSCNWQPCPGGVVPCADVLDCDPGTGVGGTMILSACGLTPGVPLWFLIDGSSGSQCQYTIEYASGVLEPQIDEEITDGQAIPGVVCQGFDDFTMTVSPEIPNAHGYIWTLGWTNQTVTSTLTTLTMDIANNAPVGVHEICVLAFSGCDTSEVPYCFEVEIVEIDDIEKDPTTFCPEEFPIDWFNVTIPGPGEYVQTFDNADGCPYDTIWTVEVYPDVEEGLLDTLHCMVDFEGFVYEGETYDDSGQYPLEYDNMGLNGCDSTAVLNLTLAGLDAYIDADCDNGEFVLRVVVDEKEPNNASLLYEWYEVGDPNVLWQDNPFMTLDGGTYYVLVTVETPAGDCVYQLDQVVVNADALRPDPPVLTNGDTVICAQEGIFFEIIPDPDDDVEWVWSAPSQVTIIDNGTNIIEMDFSANVGGEVCVYAINECGEGPSTCFTVDIQPTPESEFTYPNDACVDSTITITFSGSAGPNAIYTWDFDNPTTVVGSGVGPYTVSWSTPGDKVINLLVDEPGCATDFASGIITVSNLLTPTINCSSTINSVTFTWDDVAGASGYLVSINGGAPFDPGGITYTQTGLTPGQNVDFVLTVISAGPCDDIVLTSSCIAQNCPPPTIELGGPNSLCLNTPAPVNLTALVNGAPGTGIWSGPGITDGTLGIFDPAIAGAGQHQVTYTVDFGGCPFTASYVIDVFPFLAADFTLDPVICITDEATLTYTGGASGNANFTFDFGTATVVSGSGPGPYQLSYATPGVKTVTLQVSENGCSSEVVLQNTDVEPELVAPSVNCATNTSSVTFSWPDANGGAYVVNILSGHTGVETGTQVEFIGLVPGETVEIEITTLSSGPCPERKDTFSCVAMDCPPVGIVLTPVADICLYPSAGPQILEATVTGGNGSGSWSGPGITNATTGEFDPQVAGAGAHIVTYTYLDAGCSFIETLGIDVFDPPTAFISNTNLILTCGGGNQLLLDGSGSTSGPDIKYEWSTTTGLFIGNTDQADATAGKSGDYKLLVINELSGCKDSMTVTVTQDAATPTADAGPDQVITCLVDTFELGGNSTTGAGIQYEWTTSGGNIIGATDGIKITVDEEGLYTLKVVNTINGCEALDEVEVTTDLDVAAITLTAGDTIDCNTAVSDVEAALDEPLTDYTFKWTTTDGNISGIDTESTVTVNQGGNYTLTITSKLNGCTATASAFVPESDEIIQDVDVTLQNIVCFGDDNGALIINSVTGGTPDYTYQWSVSQGGGTSLSSLSPGVYSLTVSDKNGCSYLESFTVTEPAKVTADLGANQTVAGGDSVTINLTTNLAPGAISDIDWSGYDALDCPGCQSLQFVASSSGTVIAMITDTAGCSALDSMRLTVIIPRIIYVPTVFSPNDDDRNDWWNISGRSNLVNIAFMRIYDRWGNQVFEKTNVTPGIPEEGWDGKYNGQPMQPGVYVYVAKLEYEDIDEVITGDITIIR